MLKRSAMVVVLVGALGLLAVPAGLEARNEQCQDCDPVETSCYPNYCAEHRFNSVGEVKRLCGGDYGTDHDDCHPGFADGACVTHRVNINCGGNGFADAADVSQALLAVDTENSAALAELIRQKPTAVRYNSARGAIQIVGCNETVIAHVPVSVAVQTHLGSSTRVSTEAEN